MAQRDHAARPGDLKTLFFNDAEEHALRNLYRWRFEKEWK